MILFDNARKPVELGAEIARGGEGVIYRLQAQPPQVAKVYAPAPPSGYAEKLAWMRDHPPVYLDTGSGHAYIAWPQALLYSRDGVFAGYTMRHIQNAVPLLDVFNPSKRAKVLPDFDWHYLHRTARNLCVAVASLHARGYVVGDLNELNTLVTPTALITMIDTDSFQVRRDGRAPVTYLCMVGRPEYTPPELQGKSFREMTRLPEHDHFGLGVLVYQLLMEGSHPFRAQWLGEGDPPPLEKRIERGWFPWSRALAGPVAPPANAPSLRELHPALSALTQRCFVDGHKDPRARPRPEEWERALTKAEQELLKCPNGHAYSNHLDECPRCNARRASASPAARPAETVPREAPASRPPPVAVAAPAPAARLTRPARQVYRAATTAYPPAPRMLRSARYTAWRIGAQLRSSILTFAGAWVLVTLAGWLLGSLLGNVARGLSGNLAGDIVQGLLIALPQWLVLRHRLEGAILWIPLTVLGFAAGALVDRSFGTTLTFPAASLLTGGLQMLLLWRLTSWAPAWIVAHAVSWLVGYALGGQVALESAAMVGLTNGALTGAALVGLLPSRFWIRPRLDKRSVITIIALMLFAYAAATLFLRPCGVFDGAFRVSRCVVALQLPDAPLRAAFSPDGEVLAVESADGALSLWRADNTSAVAEWTQDAGELLAEPLFKSAGTTLQTISSGAVQTWRVRDGVLQRTQKLAGVASARITAAASSADGALTALGVCVQTACANAEARLWRTADGANAGALKGAAAAIEYLAFSPDGSLLAAAVCSATETEPCAQVDVLVWRLRDSRLLYVVRGHVGKPTDLIFSADGAQLALAAADGSVVVWRASNGEKLLQLQHTAAVNHLLFSADGNLLWGGAIPPAQWRLPAGDAVRLSDLPGAPAALSPDGKTLVLFTDDARVVLWGNGE